MEHRVSLLHVSWQRGGARRRERPPDLEDVSGSGSAEAHDEAAAELSKYVARANAIAAITPERVVREGDKAEEILKLIDEDEDIFILVLAAGVGSEGPGPLVTTIGRTAGDFPIPVAIVPGHLTDDEIDALS